MKAFVISFQMTNGESSSQAGQEKSRTKRTGVVDEEKQRIRKNAEARLSSNDARMKELEKRVDEVLAKLAGKDKNQENK